MFITKNLKIAFLKRALFFLMCLSSNPFLVAQRSTGLILDDIGYDSIPIINYIDGSKYHDLPTSKNLKAYCPIPANQENTSSCVGWALGYGAMTISRAIRDSITDRAVITNEANSAVFIHNNLVNDCQEGMALTAAFDFVKRRGDCLASNFDIEKPSCDCSPDNKLYEEAKFFKIKSYQKLFGKHTPLDDRVLATKIAISKKQPVVFGMEVDDSFYFLKDNFSTWQPKMTDKDTNNHAMVLVGYDDTERMFEVMNSYGTDWGNLGFFKIRYTDFEKYARYAFIMSIAKQNPFNCLGCSSGSKNSPNLALDTYEPLFQKTIDWNVKYGSPSNDAIQHIIENNEGTLTIVGKTVFKADRREAIYFSLADKKGTILLEKHIGIDSNQEIASFLQQKDNSYLLVGSIVRQKKKVAYVLHLNQEGEKLNEFFLEQGHLYDIALNDNGRIYATGQQNEKVVLMEINTKGKSMWQSELGSGMGHAIAVASEDRLILTGETKKQLLLLEFDMSSKQEQWRKTIKDAKGTDLVLHTPNEILVTGTTYNYHSRQDLLFLKVNRRNGNIIFKKNYGGKGNDAGLQILPTKSKNYLIAAYNQSFQTGAKRKNAWIQYLDSDGNELLRSPLILGDIHEDKVNSIIQLKDGTVVAAGQTTSNKSRKQDFWLFQLKGEKIKEHGTLNLQRKPNLHIVSIGIPSNLKYTQKDAIDFVAAFQDQSGKIFQDVFAKRFTNKEETTKDFLSAQLEQLRHQLNSKIIQPSDQLIIFISAHGGISSYDDENSLIIKASDYESDKEHTRSLDFGDDILKIINAIHCKKLIFIDACQSGAAIPGSKSFTQTSIALSERLINDVENTELRILVSCNAQQLSYEDAAWQNGAFTKAILEAFENKKVQTSQGKTTADKNGNGEISIAELYQFISIRVPFLVEKIKGKQQTPFLHQKFQNDEQAIFKLNQ